MNTAQERLKSELEIRKKRNPNFSLRAFARWLSVSPGQLSQMLSGKRTITPKILDKIGQRLDFSPIEKSQLEASLIPNQGSNTNSESATNKLLDDQFTAISDWYHFAILSLSKVRGANPDPRWISRTLGIQVNEASEAIQRLERMGLLETKPSFKQVGDPIEVASDVPSSAIRRFHQQILGLAQEKIEQVDKVHRDFQSITIPIEQKNLNQFRNHINAFLDLAAKQSEKDVSSKKCDHVYQLNVQLFPLTKLTTEN